MTTEGRVSERLLIIDDDAELSAMLTEYLRDEGFESEVAADGETGVKAVLAGRFDAVILDIMMPGMDGIEVLRRIRRLSDVPVIMLTARGDNFDRVSGLEMGADDYLAKPYYPLELVARIRRCCGGGRNRRADLNLHRCAAPLSDSAPSSVVPDTGIATST